MASSKMRFTCPTSSRGHESKLRVMAKVAAPTAKVLFRVAESNGSANVETLWAHDLGSDRYKLDNSPFYAYVVSADDTVFAPHDDAEGLPTFRSVVAKPGNRTVRIVFDPPVVSGNESDGVLQGLVALGCAARRTRST